VPQDVGPMAITYRADIFKKYGLAAPKTWDEFAADARKIHAADKDVTITSFPATEFAQWAGIATQAGGTWWKLENGKWTVGIGDAATLKVADFFEKLYDEGVISTDALLTPAYDKALNNGTMLSWPSAVWAPSVLYSVAEGTAGKWEMARMPSWTAGDNTVTYEGGSSLSVTKDSKYPAQAAEFINWYNASTQGVKMLINDQALFPAASEGQKIAEDQAPPDLMPQQKDFYKLAADIAADTKPILWGPDANLATSKLQDNLNKAIENHTPWRDAFTATQQAVVADMKSNGFPVTNK
jgi:multiple sugar transport system substrate-binding protein